MKHFYRAARAVSAADFQVASDAMLRTCATNPAAEAYVKGLLSIKKMWAFCYRNNVLFLGVASTQRCEGYFSLLKAHLVKQMYLCQLYDRIDALERQRRLDAAAAGDSSRMVPALQALQRARGHQADAIKRNLAAFNDVLQLAEEHGTTYCHNFLVQEANLTPFYNVHRLGCESDDMDAIVSTHFASAPHDLQRDPRTGE